MNILNEGNSKGLYKTFGRNNYQFNNIFEKKLVWKIFFNQINKNISEDVHFGFLNTKENIYSTSQ